MSPLLQKVLAVILIIFGALLGYLLFTRPALERKETSEQRLSALEAGVSPENKVIKQLQSQPPRRAIVSFVQRAAQEESLTVKDLSWDGAQLQISIDQDPSRLAALARNLSENIFIGKEIRVEGPGVAPVSMRSDFLPRVTLSVDSLYNLSR